MPRPCFQSKRGGFLSFLTHIETPFSLKERVHSHIFERKLVLFDSKKNAQISYEEVENDFEKYLKGLRLNVHKKSKTLTGKNKNNL